MLFGLRLSPWIHKVGGRGAVNCCGSGNYNSECCYHSPITKFTDLEGSPMDQIIGPALDWAGMCGAILHAGPIWHVILHKGGWFGTSQHAICSRGLNQNVGSGYRPTLCAYIMQRPQTGFAGSDSLSTASLNNSTFVTTTTWRTAVTSFLFI